MTTDKLTWLRQFRFPKRIGAIFLALLLVVSAAQAVFAQKPFANSETKLPPGYQGPKFELSYNYPSDLPEPDMPWRQTLGGKPLSKATAGAYSNMLKKAVTKSMKKLIADYPNWNAEEMGWYNQPWLSSIREPIHGMFQATSTSASLFNDPSLNVKYVNDFGAVYYDATAAQTLGKFWGPTAMKPDFNPSASQFAEGSIIVKLAFTEVTGEQWPIMKGSPCWTIYAQRLDPETQEKATTPSMFDVQLLQLDIIVKDSVAAPQTGWVYSTLVYDNRIKGDFWDRMIPLGAMWGNDPDVISPATQGFRADLQETWINDRSPKYSQQTLGWGGRLSGPNDQAVQAPGEYIDPDTGKPGTVPVANSSCMSCHSPAEWQKQSFLMPGYATSTGYYMAKPGSPNWMRWFQNRPGTEPMDAGSVAMDYDMMFSFKALPHWATATQKPINNLHLFRRPSELSSPKLGHGSPVHERSYNGLHFKSLENRK